MSCRYQKWCQMKFSYICDWEIKGNARSKWCCDLQKLKNLKNNHFNTIFGPLPNIIICHKRHIWMFFFKYEGYKKISFRNYIKPCNLKFHFKSYNSLNFYSFGKLWLSSKSYNSCKSSLHLNFWISFNSWIFKILLFCDIFKSHNQFM